jgi:hypothetical protein
MTQSIGLRFSKTYFSGIAVALSILLASLGCGLSSAGAPRPSPPPTPSGTVPQFGHVVVVVEENSSYSEVIGSSEMPYLNSLAKQYGLATQYFANTHPSIGNYFMLTTGQIVTNDDSFTGRVDVDNIVRELLASGKSWKSYAESRNDPLLYAKRHDPLSYFSDVVDSSTQLQNLTLLSQFSSDSSKRRPAKLFLCRAESFKRRAQWPFAGCGRMAPGQYRATDLECDISEGRIADHRLR